MSEQKSGGNGGGSEKEFVKVVFNTNEYYQKEPELDKEGQSQDYGQTHMKTNMRSINAVFETKNPIDRNIMSALYMQSMNQWAKAGDVTLASSLKQMLVYADLLQSASGSIGKV